MKNINLEQFRNRVINISNSYVNGEDILVDLLLLAKDINEAINQETVKKKTFDDVTISNASLIEYISEIENVIYPTKFMIDGNIFENDLDKFRRDLNILKDKLSKQDNNAELEILEYKECYTYDEDHYIEFLFSLYIESKEQLIETQKYLKEKFIRTD